MQNFAVEIVKMRNRNFIDFEGRKQRTRDWKQFLEWNVSYKKDKKQNK